MKFNKTVLFVLLFSLAFSAHSQLLDLNGKVIGVGSVEGLHVLNKTALKYNITDENGYFTIPAKINDTIVFSGLTYKLKQIIVTKTMISKNEIEVQLIEDITQLDPVVVGKILTGNVGSDLKNLKIKTPINFYDLGISGYTGKQKTLEERKLAEAMSGGGLFPLNPLLSLITGRTKQLKKQLKLSKDMKCVDRLKSSYKDLIFENKELSEELQNRFFDFIMDSPNLQKACASKNVLFPIDFLMDELKLFKLRLSENEQKN